MIPILVKSLLLTLAVELPLGALLGLRRGREVLDWTLINLITNPPVVFCITLVRKFIPTLAWPVFWLAEALVMALEWLLLRRAVGLKAQRALGVSLLCNTASLLAGMLV